ncbi:MAG TPA: type II toxin-antitoxin system RelE/ParE family toxin [Candidatus Manganitrophaceae bacterium]|nr:type II toxin-antitoxin system RelE/ParE family toxin [Candidatus Manganitrophaceae bacterium]
MPERNVVEYLEGGVSPFGQWLHKLASQAAAKVATAVYRLEQGHSSNIKSVGQGVSEYKIDFGPGYRIYFGQEGDLLIILLGGGTKKSQKRDINTAQRLWAQYKMSKKG